MNWLRILILITLNFIFNSSHAQNYSVSFDGVNDYVQIPSNIYASSVSNFTIECWVKPNSGSFNNNYHAIFGCQNIATGLTYDRNPGLWVINGTIHYDMYEPTTMTRYTGNSATTIAQDKWCHLALVKSGTSLKLYINGKVDISATVSTNVRVVGNYRIGYTDNYFSGLIDEVRFWSTARTQQELLNFLYKSPAYNSTGLIAMYKMNSSSGTTAVNTCTNTASINATLTNGPTWASSASVAFSANAINLSGTSDYLQGDLTGSASSTVTMECWIKFNSLTGQQNFLGLYQSLVPGTSCRMIPYKTASNTIDCYFCNAAGTASNTTSSFTVAANTWYHMAFVYDNNKSYVYINGTLRASNTSAVTYSLDGADVLAVGADRTSGQSAINADVTIDELRIWTTARSAAQIGENYDKYIPVTTTGMLAYYPFDQGNPSNTNTDLTQFYNARANGDLFPGSLTMSGSSSNLVAQGSALSSNYTWMGNTNTSFATATNWSEEVVPPTSANIEVISNATYLPVLDQSRVIGDLILPSSSTFSLNGYTLTVDGKLSGTGTFIAGGTSALNFLTSYSASTLYLSQTTNRTTNSLTSLSFSMSYGASITLGNTTFVTGLFGLTSGTVNTGGNLTLRSTSSGTCMTTDMSDGTLSGNVTVERYIPGRRAFRLLSSPVSTTNTIYNNWQEGGSAVAGFGTHITGSSTGSNGFDATASGNPSLFTLNNLNSTWSAINSTNNATNDKLVAGVPYRLLIRGDRTISLTSANPTATNTTLRATGTLYSGNKTFSGLNTEASAFSLIGNPYQAAVDMNTLLSSASYNTNLNAVYYYVWDPTVGNRGAYVTIDLSTNTNNVSGSKANKYLQPWQGCFVKTKNTGTASFTFSEMAKNTTSTATWRTSFDIPRMSVNIYQTDSLKNDQLPLDGLQVRFKDTYSPLIDDYDALKPQNQDENFSILLLGNKLSIECRNNPESTDTIQFLLEQTRHTDYTLKFEPMNINGIDFVLWDNYLKQSTQLSRSETSYYRFQLDPQVLESKASDRFSLLSSSGMMSTKDESKMNVSLVPNPSSGIVRLVAPTSTFVHHINILNIEGQFIKEIPKSQLTSINMEGFPTGIYIFEIWDNQSNRSMIKFCKE